MSPRAYEPQHVIARDVEDLQSLMIHTGARFLFGLSSGAIITLATALATRSVQRAAVYEPPFYAQGISHAKIEEFKRQVERGDLAGALVTAGRIVQLAPAALKAVPDAVLKIGTRALLRREAKKPAGLYLSLRELIPAMRYDFAVVGGMDGKIHSFESLSTPVLLMGGDRSPGYLRGALTALQQVLPHSSRVELAGLDHSGPWNQDRGGHPEKVAAALRAFFAS